METLEELREVIHLPSQNAPLAETQGILRALEELGSDFVRLPFGRDGAIQASLLRLGGSAERIARVIGCEKKSAHMPMECDGVISNAPCIIAVDFNVKRIVRALEQIRQTDASVVPRICCMQFQKSTLSKLLWLLS